MVMVCDRFTSVAGNIRSLTLAIEGLRQLDRHGGGRMLEKAFDGFKALAPPNWKKHWREVFSVKPDWTGDIAAWAAVWTVGAIEFLTVAGSMCQPSTSPIGSSCLGLRAPHRAMVGPWSST